MKKILIIIIIVFSILLTAEESFIKRGGDIFRLVIDENGDTLIFEKINVMDKIDDAGPLVEEPTINKTIPVEYDPQWLKSIIPYRWQVGLYGIYRGPFYGFCLAQGFLPDKLGGIAPEDSFATISELKSRLVYFSAATMPLIMFLAPPLLLNDSISPISIPIIDMGYFLGPMDYVAIRLLAAGDSQMENYELGLAALSGYAESWGGYFLLQHLGDFNRAAGHFYNAGAFLGYLWGGLQGIYIADKIYPQENDSTYTNYSNNMRIASGIALTYSLGFRALGFYMGNNDNYKWRSFDSWLMAVNTIPGMLLAGEILEQWDMDVESMLLISGMSMLTTGLTGYLLRDTHFDDANAILTIVGGGLGAAVGGGINIFFDKYHPALSAIGMITGELAVYYLRKNSIGDNLQVSIPSNINFGFYPTIHNGMGANLNIDF